MRKLFKETASLIKESISVNYALADLSSLDMFESFAARIGAFFREVGLSENKVSPVPVHVSSRSRDFTMKF